MQLGYLSPMHKCAMCFQVTAVTTVINSLNVQVHEIILLYSSPHGILIQQFNSIFKVL